MRYQIFEIREICAAPIGVMLAGSVAQVCVALATITWILPPKDSPLRGELARLFSDGELPFAPIETGSVMIIGRLLTEGQFLTLLSPSQIALQINAGLLARVGPPLPDTTRRLGMVVRQDWRPTRLQRRFTEILMDLGENPEKQETHSIASHGWV